jgi:branched-chain amino acid transport system substrate-binding protein
LQNYLHHADCVQIRNSQFTGPLFDKLCNGSEIRQRLKFRKESEGFMVSTTAIALLVIGLVVGAAVGYGVSVLAPSTTTTSTATKTITIGSIEPLSGAYAAYGLSFQQAVQLAVNQMNANLTAAGNNLQFKVVTADDAGTPQGAESALTTMYSTYGIHALIGPLTSAEVQGLLQTADNDHIVVLPPAATATSLEYPKSSTNYLVRPGQPGDQYEGSALAQTVIQLGAKNVVYLYRDDTSESGTYNFSSALMTSAGLKVDGIQFQPGQTDYGTQVATAESDAQTFLSSGGTTSNTVVVCACSATTEDQNIFTHAAGDQYLSELRWFGIEAIATPVLLTSSTGAWMSKVNFTITSPASFASPQLTYFNSTFIAAYGTAPQPYSNYAYDNAWIAMLAILMTGGNNNGQDILNAVTLAADHYFGATGTGVWLDNNNEQTFAIYDILECIPSGTSASTTTQIGTYNGATNAVTLNAG